MGPVSVSAHREGIPLPPRPFLYTLDQIATLFWVKIEPFKRDYCYWDGRSLGAAPRDKLRCVNIAPKGITPDWRVNEPELKRFLKAKHFRSHERGWNPEPANTP